MDVLAHRPSVWYLAREADCLYLDINCVSRTHAVDFSMLIRLTPQEEVGYREGGEGAIDKLAERMSTAAHTLFDSRHLGPEWEAKLIQAIRRWKSEEKLS